MTTTQPEHPVFLDSEGTPIEIGDKVQFVPRDPENAVEPWTSDRTGIVYDFASDSHGQAVGIHQYGNGSLTRSWAHDEFLCGPERLKVVAKAHYGRVGTEMNALLDTLAELMNAPSDTKLGRILNRETGRMGLQRAITEVRETMRTLGVKEA
jgi:hypothetical protein